MPLPSVNWLLLCPYSSHTVLILNQAVWRPFRSSRGRLARKHTHIHEIVGYSIRSRTSRKTSILRNYWLVPLTVNLQRLTRRAKAKRWQRCVQKHAEVNPQPMMWKAALFYRVSKKCTLSNLCRLIAQWELKPLEDTSCTAAWSYVHIKNAGR